MDGKGVGFLSIIIVWGGLFYLFSLTTGTPINVSANSGLFPASAFSAIGSSLSSGGTADAPFGLAGADGSFQKSQTYFGSPVEIYDIAVSPSGSSLVFAGSNAGLFASKDGGLNWYAFSDIERKLNSKTEVYKILFNPENKNEAFVSVFENGKGIVYKSENNFFSVEKIIEFDSEGAYDFDIRNGNLYFGLSNGKLVIYSLAKNESRVLTALSSPITRLKVAPGDLIYLTLKSGGVYSSYDGGQSFSRLKYLDNYKGANKINGFFVSSTNPSFLYAATDYGFIRSLDAGATWKVFKDLPSDIAKVSAVSVNGKGEIFTASNNKIFKSRDNGQNWQIILTNINGGQISVMAFGEDRVIIGTGK